MRQGHHLADDSPDSQLVEFVIGHLMFALLHALDHAYPGHGFAAAWTQGDAAETLLATADELIE